MLRIWKLKAENLQNVGGPMWDQSTDTMWEKYFESLLDAQAYAEKWYNKQEKTSTKIKWTRQYGRFSSGDLRWVEFEIEKIKVHPNKVAR